MRSITLEEADRLEVTVLVDNYTDNLLMQQTDLIHRRRVIPPAWLFAEHGLSCLVKVEGGGEQHVVLMDGGISGECLVHNTGILDVNPGSIESVVLSHGHHDHFGGLVPFLGQLNRGIMVHLHPEAFLSRRLKLPVAPGPVGIPRLDRAALEHAGAELVLSRTAAPFAGGMLMLTGEVERTTPFEKGFPGAEAEIGGKWVPDPFHDDQALVVHLQGKGLVVISGCAHAGIINTVEHAKRITGIDTVHAVLGGFHLSGPLFEPVIPPTIAAMQAINPDYIIPMHCTGWEAITRFAAAMPGKFILNTVGTRYCFSEDSSK